LSDPVVRRTVTLTGAEPPGEASQWTGRAMARHTRISCVRVQRAAIRGDHRRSPPGASRGQARHLQPHRIRISKRSINPEGAAKLEDIVGLYVDPPKHAVVLSVDEKSQIQALDRTQTGLPLKPGKAGTMTHLCTSPAGQELS
jgi:hypothetical protein